MAVEEVKAEVIDVDVTPLSGAEKWLAEMSERVAKIASEHHAYEIEDAETFDQAKRERAAIRRDANEIDNERKSMTRVIDDAVKKFRADTKNMLAPLTELDEAYKAEIDAYTDRKMKERKARLEDHYRELAPLLAIPSEDGRALVPFDRLLERYGMGQLGKKWLLAGTSEREAEKELEQALDQIQQYERTIAGAVAPSDADDIRAIYFDTLDMGTAMAELDNRKRQRARLEALEQERREIEQWQRNVEPEPTVETAPDATFAPAQPMPESMPAPTPSAPTMIRDDWYQWVFVGYCNEEQAMALSEFCSMNGIDRFKVAHTNGKKYQLTAIG
jgi:uncharacterized protein YqcC (DUF446 family)